VKKSPLFVNAFEEIDLFIALSYKMTHLFFHKSLEQDE
jgi:hypothetical protein